MARRTDASRCTPSLTPAGAFVVQLRSDSDVPRRRLRGRVEHVMSGRSEPFTSLTDLLAFLARYGGTGPPSPGQSVGDEGSGGSTHGIPDR